MSTISPVRTFFTLNFTVVPGLPFIFSEHSALVRPWVVCPSISRISSPHLSPYLSAGEPLYGSLMITLPSLSGL